MRAAAIQLTSTADRFRNLETAERLLRGAAADGARLAVLPEMFNILGDAEVLRTGAEPLDGPTMAWATNIASELGLWLIAGSFLERVEGQSHLGNTSCLIDPEGKIRACYRKIHLFDCNIPDATIRESEVFQGGNELVSCAVDGVQQGLSICYDLRFPELFRILALRGARMVALASAFTERTGRDHWEILVRARAIENQVYMIAANQLGASTPRLRWYGRSMIVDPWGTILAQAPDRETYIVASLDLSAQQAIRSRLPCLDHRRPDTYHWPEGMGAEKGPGQPAGKLPTVPGHEG